MTYEQWVARFAAATEQERMRLALRRDYYRRYISRNRRQT